MTKVLIIEDEDLVARMYEKALNFDGFEVVTAIGGVEGIQKTKSEKPDIILCDIMMPDPNGMEVLEALKTDPETSHLPVVMLTNLSGVHDVELATLKGAQDYWVKKDLKPKELGTKIKQLLSMETSLKKEE